MSDKRIDYSDIPPIPAKWFKTARRPTPRELSEARQAIERLTGKPRPVRRGRPFLGPLKARDIHLRIPPWILQRLRAKADKRGIGYQTLINEILSRAA